MSKGYIACNSCININNYTGKCDRCEFCIGDAEPSQYRTSIRQPTPKPNSNPALWSMVIADMAQRDVMGAAKYGTRLQADNGRDMLQDAYEEVLDLAVYLKGAIMERSK